jgi:hypothetical protein
LGTAIEEMMADMSDLLPKKRSTNDWAPDGALTKHFLDLTNRQAEAEIVTVSWAITAAKKPVLPIRYWLRHRPPPRFKFHHRFLAARSIAAIIRRLRHPRGDRSEPAPIFWCCMRPQNAVDVSLILEDVLIVG